MQPPDANTQPNLLSLESAAQSAQLTEPRWLLRFFAPEKVPVQRYTLDSSAYPMGKSHSLAASQQFLQIDQIVAIVAASPLLLQSTKTSLNQLLQMKPGLPVLIDSPDVSDETWYYFIQAAGAMLEFDACISTEAGLKKFMDFHRGYKMLFLACSPRLYRRLGPLIAQIKNDETRPVSLLVYRETLIELLSQQPTRANHTNALMHMQGYFRKTESPAARAKLTQFIQDYYAGEVPLTKVILLIRELMKNSPHPWLQQQRYLFPRLPLRFSAHNLNAGEV